MQLKIMKLANLVNDEDGNVESSLTVIPLLLLFLATLQIITTINFRNIDFANTQSQASLQSVHQIVETGDHLIPLESGRFGDELRLLVVKSEREIPSIFPGLAHLLNGRKLKTEGAAVYEESEVCTGGYQVC